MIDSITFTTPTLTATSNAGSSEVVTITGFSDNNYNLTTITDGALTITKRDITAVVNNASRAYGDANPVFTWSDVVWNNLVNGDTGADLDTVSIAAPTAIVTSNAGTTHNINVTSFSDNNYNLTTVTDGSLNITKANLILAVENATRRQGEPNPAFTYVISGLKNGDVASAIISGVNLTTLANSSSLMGGTYDIDASGGVVGSNYQIVSYISGELTVLQSNSLPTTVERAVQDAVQVTGTNNATTSVVVAQEQNSTDKDIVVMDDHEIKTLEKGDSNNLNALIIVSKQFLKALEDRVADELSYLKPRENRPVAL